MIKKRKTKQKYHKRILTTKREKNILRTLNELYTLYKYFKFLIVNKNVNSQFLSRFLTKKQLIEQELCLKKAEFFVDYLDRSLSFLVWDSHELLNNIFIENKKQSDLPYSQSTFYRKRKKSIRELLEIIPLKRIEEIIKEYRVIHNRLRNKNK